jgi:cytochrome c553
VKKIANGTTLAAINASLSVSAMRSLANVLTEQDKLNLAAYISSAK